MDVFNALFQDLGDAVVIANHQSQLVFMNAQARSLFAQTPSILLDATAHADYQLLEAGSNSLDSNAVPPFQQLFAGHRFCDQEFLLRSLQGRPDVWLAITGHAFTLPSQNFQGGVLIIRDITHLKTNVAESTPTRDQLTGLVNRAVFMDRIQHALEKTQRKEDLFIALMCLDVTRLKAINDTFGYLIGDRLLVEIAHRLSHIIRPGDTLSRLGGDEFTLLIEDATSYSEVVSIAETIHESLASPFKLDEHEINIGTSIGITLSSQETQDANTLLKQADLAMHQSKNQFGEQYCIFESTMKADADDSLHLEMALKKALQNQELFLEYQPIFLVRNQAVIGMESLVRWHHPTQGLLPPGNFISMAEKTGLIIPLGWWVLEESCRQLKFWQNTIPNAQNMFISVNMSSKQFAQKGILTTISDILSKTGLAAEFLKIEITESVLINNPASIIEVLEAIRAMGIKLSIDDFGTGYSSLSYLYRFPVDTLKIDRSFLENADSDYEKLEILQSVVRLAWNLGLEVVAEGIETQKHLTQVKSLRCESGQGYLFSRPLGVQAMEDILQRQEL